MTRKHFSAQFSVLSLLCFSAKLGWGLDKSAVRLSVTVRPTSPSQTSQGPAGVFSLFHANKRSANTIRLWPAMMDSIKPNKNKLGKKALSL